MVQGLEFFGFTQESIKEHQGQAVKDNDFEVHADAWDSWLFFLKVSRQWIFVPVSAGMAYSSVRFGLNWSGVEAMVRLCRIPWRRWEQLVDDLLVIEEAVLEAEAERSKQETG